MAIEIGMLGAVVIFLASDLLFVYRDAGLTELNTRMSTGPAAGIYTTEQEAEKYENLMSIIREYMPAGERVLFVSLCPFGYMDLDLKVAAPSVWTRNLDYTGFEIYYKNNSDNQPKAIFLLDGEYGRGHNLEVRWGEFMENYLEEHEHEVIETTAGMILLF